MKILEIVHGFPPAAENGSEIYARAHALALGRCFGDEVVVLTREQDPARADYSVRTEHRDGLRIVWVNNTFRSMRTFEDTYRNEAIGAIARRIIDDVRPDVAHIHHLTCLSTTIVRSLAERQIPCFVTLHDYWFICHRGQLLDAAYHVCDGPGKNSPTGCGACLGPAAGAGRAAFLGAATIREVERRLPVAPARHLRQVASQMATLVSRSGTAEDQERKRIEHMRAVLSDVTHFIAPSRHMRDRFVEFGIAPERISVSGYGFDHTPFERTARGASDHLRLGFLGSLMVSKAPHVLLDAAHRLPRGAVSVDLFGAYSAYHGDDRYKKQLEPFLKQDGVRVHGQVAHDLVPQALASIDVLVVPSIWPENSPLVIHEAFLAGIPVVASRIGGIPEVVVEGKNGMLFRAGEPEDLARVLTRLVDEPRLLQTLGAGIAPVRTIEDDVAFARNLYLEGRPVPSFRAAVRVAATVLNFRTPDDTFLAVKSLLASSRPIDEIIVVDNDSGDDTRDRLRDVWSQITFIQANSNLGFSGGMNAGIREALARGAERVLLVNSDVVVPPDAVQRLERCLEAAPEAGIAGPVVLARSDPAQIASLGISYAPTTGRMRHRGTGASLSGHEPPESLVVDGVSGCLMLVKREVFEAIGLLDEDYFFSFEDLDFCLRARRAGFSTLLAGRARVYHEGGRSIGATSPRRLYFAARNHLLLSRRGAPSAGRFATRCRACSIVMLNLAHAVRSTGGSLPTRLGAVLHGIRDYAAGRFGPCP